VKGAFECSIRFRVGNGTKIMFWQDNWLGEILQQIYPDIYDIE
jgi:hypothetical protein